MTRPLHLYNSLTRQLEPFTPIDPACVRVYTCGPTVYNYQHIGNMRAFLFADTLGRVLRWRGWPLRHVINITDVGHLTSDADAGDDKMERAAQAQAKSIWEIAAHYTEAFKDDVARLNITPPYVWSVATDHIAEMIAFAQSIAPNHCYELDSGLYFDATSVPDYGRLARAGAEEPGESRIDPVAGKRHPQDFAIWRKESPSENRQMAWDSPWGRGAPGWHLECSVMSLKHLGHPFDIHTGGIDHREIHHPNEIAQNQAYCACADSGARLWMHNNFLLDRAGKMSKSAGEFLRLQVLVDRSYHPLAYRLLCLQAHYRSELEFSWEQLAAAFTRLKRLVMAARRRLPEAIEPGDPAPAERYLAALDEAVSNDLNTARDAGAGGTARRQTRAAARAGGGARAVRRGARAGIADPDARGVAGDAPRRGADTRRGRGTPGRTARGARGQGFRRERRDPRRADRAGRRGDGRRSAGVGLAARSVTAWRMDSQSASR